jgi:AraC-like DNA-binding protein
MTVKPGGLTETPGSAANAASPGVSLDAAQSLRDALERLSLKGAIFLRAEYTEAWALWGLGGPVIANLLHPGADRLIFFDVVASGRCWESLADGERHWASAGDVIVLPYGDPHTIGGVEPTEPVPITSVLPPPPWERLPIVRHGKGGSRTDIVCGFLHSDDVLFDPALRALPPLFVVRPPGGPAARWVEANISFALEQSGERGLRSTRLPELLLLEILRLHLSTAPAADRGWLAAMRDPVLAPALARLHAEPARRWSVTELAAAAAVSRSALDSRFRQLLGISPIRYLTDWRMHIAREMLATTETTIFAIARRVGYESEEAFSRAFKRFQGCAPSVWRNSLFSV